MNSIKILFILFSLLSYPFLLFARDALLVLVEGGESLENRDDFYISYEHIIKSIEVLYLSIYERIKL